MSTIDTLTYPTAFYTSTVPAQTRTRRPVVASADGELAAAVTRVANRPELWEHLVEFHPDRRHRVQIPTDEAVDVWLVTWNTFQRTDLHDHGGAEGAFTTVQGVLTQILPDDAGRLIPRKYAPGIVGSVLPGEIHDVRNEHVDPAVSIHAYSPSLTTMTCYSWSPSGYRGGGLVLPDRTISAFDDQPEPW